MREALGGRCGERYMIEHRHVAVDHFLEYGRCIRCTVCALGYPCREVLNTGSMSWPWPSAPSSDANGREDAS